MHISPYGARIGVNASDGHRPQPAKLDPPDESPATSAPRLTWCVLVLGGLAQSRPSVSSSGRSFPGIDDPTSDLT